MGYCSFPILILVRFVGDDNLDCFVLFAQGIDTFRALSHLNLVFHGIFGRMQNFTFVPQITAEVEEVDPDFRPVSPEM